MRINSYTHVIRPNEGSVELAPGEVPEWAEALITNPAIIVSDDIEADDTDESGEGTEDEESADEESEEETPEAEIPKKGSSAKKWAAYALSKGFEVDEDATAASIREALEAEGIPTE